jgi:hypothetical protein
MLWLLFSFISNTSWSKGTFIVVMRTMYNLISVFGTCICTLHDLYFSCSNCFHCIVSLWFQVVIVLVYGMWVHVTGRGMRVISGHNLTKAVIEWGGRPRTWTSSARWSRNGATAKAGDSDQVIQTTAKANLIYAYLPRTWPGRLLICCSARITLNQLLTEY